MIDELNKEWNDKSYKDILILLYIYKMYVTPRQAREHYKVSEKTLKRWSDSGKIKFINTKGLHRRYLIEDTTNETERNFIYARVSSRKQSEDLQRQIEYLSAKIEGADIISDIGSGFNYNRPGFQRIIKEVINFTFKFRCIIRTHRLNISFYIIYYYYIFLLNY